MEIEISKSIILTVLISAGVLILGALFSAGFYGLFDMGHALQLMDISVTLFLSGALVYLYFQQQQVLESQTELKRSELSGELDVNDISYDDKSIEVKLSNLSGSEISDVRLRTEIFPKNIGEMNIIASRKRLQRSDENETQFARSAGLAPREQNVPFTAEPTVHYFDEEGHEKLANLSFFITVLRDMDIDKVKCRMWVEGKDQLDQTVKSKVFRWDKTIRVNTEKPLHALPDLEGIVHRSISASIEDSKSEY